MVLKVHEEVLGNSSEIRSYQCNTKSPELACNCTGKDNIMVVAKQKHSLFMQCIQYLKPKTRHWNCLKPSKVNSLHFLRIQNTPFGYSFYKVIETNVYSVKKQIDTRTLPNIGTYYKLRKLLLFWLTLRINSEAIICLNILPILRPIETYKLSSLNRERKCCFGQ